MHSSILITTRPLHFLLPPGHWRVGCFKVFFSYSLLDLYYKMQKKEPETEDHNCKPNIIPEYGCAHRPRLFDTISNYRLSFTTVRSICLNVKGRISPFLFLKEILFELKYFYDTFIKDKKYCTLLNENTFLFCNNEAVLSVLGTTMGTTLSFSIKYFARYEPFGL